MTGARSGIRTDGRIWAAVAYKGTVGVKQRLTGLLDEPERIALGLSMLEDVVAALLGVSAVERILVATPALDLAERWTDPRLVVIADVDDDSGAAGRLNAAFARAQGIARQDGVDAILLIPADLPLLSGGAIDALIRARATPGVVLAPDRGSGGTNALLLSPPDLLAPRFGEGSFGRHRRAADTADVPVTIVARAELALDIDTPADVAALLANDADSRARRLLLQLGVDRRLEGLADVGLRYQSRSATT